MIFPLLEVDKPLGRLVAPFNMVTGSLSIIVVFCLAVLIGCDRTSSKMQSKEVEPVDSPTHQEIQDLQLFARDREAVSVVRDNHSGCWQTDVTRIDRRAIVEADFLGPASGWAVVSEVAATKEALRDLYRTNNTGASWQKVTPKLSRNARLSLVHFVSERVGWISVEEKSNSPRVETIVRIFRTFDGGVTWSAGTPITIERAIKLQFNEKGEGWLLGHRELVGKSTRDIGAIFRSNDYGESWTEIRLPLTFQTKTESSPDNAEEIWIDFDFRTSSAIFLSMTGLVVQTLDDGATWSVVNDLSTVEKDDVVGGAGYHLLVIAPDSRIFVFGGRNSQEGVLTDVVIIERNEVTKKYRAQDVYVEDAVFWGDRLLLGGTLVTKTRSNVVERRAVVMSSGNVRDWRVVFEVPDDCPSCSSYFKLSFSSKSIIAVSKSGVVVRASPRANGSACSEQAGQ